MFEEKYEKWIKEIKPFEYVKDTLNRIKKPDDTEEDIFDRVCSYLFLAFQNGYKAGFHDAKNLTITKE